MNLKEFHFDLPDELIAQEPIEKRDMSRLLVINKDTGNIEHRIFNEIIEYLESGDCLVMNDTKVIPARLFGEKKNTGGSIEFMLLNRKNIDTWEVMVRPGKKAKIGSIFVFGDEELEAEVIDIIDGGNRIVKFSYDGVFENILDRLGKMPLPPYIKKELIDRDRYQTVYSRYEGSAAAPTAGLHFTNELMDKIRSKGVKIVFITLHVGLGTFRPVKVENILDHRMHSEYYSISDESADIINSVRNSGKKIICVGTTSARTIESASDNNGVLKPGSGWTDIFIYPGYEFKIMNALITNFHLPESTLLMLVSAFSSKDIIMDAYNEAVKQRYRFFSFGDAMFIY